MNHLSIASFVMPAAPLGPENPLAPLRSYETASAAGAGAADADYPDRGEEASILPYRLQDQYDRQRQPRPFKTAVLENHHLRATFLLDFGGRLWSLIHKPTRRELLYVNPVFQPANLAVRDAWFTGGVEWNIAIIGHCPFTCSPLFAARVKNDDGSDVLRLYEWDRVRRVPFQIDFWLPDDVPFLMARVRITNPNDHTVPMYWWSNIAVPERKDVRVLGPAERAYRHDYDGTLVEHDIPNYEGSDVTYTTNRRHAADLYFQIPKGNRPWIAALAADGCGLLHTSTDRLIGRKMFNWGMDPGGRRWQEFLSEPGQAYIEIQGGLAQTQGEYVAMPAGEQWSWLEAYALIEVNPAKAHDPTNWKSAYTAVENELERRLPRARVQEEVERTRALADRAPTEILHQGSGWGALERIRQQRASSKAHPSGVGSRATPFPDTSLSDDQLPWLNLLNDGALPYRAPSEDPGTLMVQPEWRDLLEKSVRNQKNAHWLAWYHLAVQHFRARDKAAAKHAWEQSLTLEKSPWAYRDLAILARETGDLKASANLYLTAIQTAPHLAPLAIEAAKALLLADRPGDLLKMTETLPPEVRAHGRIRLLRAMAALALDDLNSVEEYFQGDVDIANIREKETALSDLWFGLQAKRVARERSVQVDQQVRDFVHKEFPPPAKFDFRLNAELS